MADSRIQVSELIAELRRELLAAQEKGESENLKFHIPEVEVELQFTATKEASGNFEVKFWVFTSAEAGGKLASEAVQKLRFKLLPTTPEGELLVGNPSRKPVD